MSRYEAAFAIESKTEAHCARLLTEQVYNTLREELRRSGQDGTSSKEMLRDFKSIREAARRPSSGTLTVIYESDDDSFDG